ncbi:MAG: VanW family protein [Nitriliruptorales bacterium]|nr:VanW family protein [Nitriliruptorales bacterium]
MTYPRTRPVSSDVRVERKPRTGRRLLLGGLATLAVVTLGIVALALTHRGVLPGVTVAGVEAGGMSQQELTSELEPIVAAAADDPVVFTHNGDELTVLPSDAGFTPSVAATTEAAWSIGREGNLLSRGWAHVASLWRTVEVPLAGGIDDTAITATVDEVETSITVEPFPGGISADPQTLEVTTRAPEQGFELDRDGFEADLRAAFGTPGVETLEIPGTFTLPSTDIGDVEAVAELARGALTAPFEASIPVVDEAVTLSPSELAPLLTAALVDGELALAIDQQLVGEVFGQRVDLFEVAPRDASWNLPRAPQAELDDKGDVSWSPVDVTASVVPSKPGRAFDPEAVATQMADVLASGDHSANFDLPMVEPEFTTADAREFGVTQLLGTFTSYHAPGQPRVTNIQTLADVIDGTRVAPGEQFSINQLSGERTCERGYVEDAMILNHKLVDVCGGGVSQFGTTMMNAAFFAGLPIDQHKAHSHYIDRYPMGREATLNYPSPDIDVRWTNDTGNGIYIRTSYTDTSITVSIYGTSDVAEVSARHSAPFRQRQAPVEYIENRGLEPGQSRVVETGINGFDIEVYRTIERTDGTVDRDEFFTRYVTIPTLVERNSAEPKPEPEPSPSPSPKDEPKDGDTTSDAPKENDATTSKQDTEKAKPTPAPTP